ncbi:MAG: hypothetical protein R3Y09_02885 [Clostridia bacterium]
MCNNNNCGGCSPNCGCQSDCGCNSSNYGSFGGFSQDYIWIILVVIIILFGFGGFGGGLGNNGCKPNPCC